MQEWLLKRPTRTVVLVALAIAAATLLLCALTAGSTGAAAQARPRHATHHATHHARHHARVADPAGGTADPDNVQSGDQSTPDTPSETSGENESNVESEQGQAGEPANGHQDAPGANVNHECTGNCVE